MDYRSAPWVLTWDEVDPSRHPFDAAAARDTIRGLGPASAVPKRPSGGAADRRVRDWAHDAGEAWADSMTRALIEQYGRWATGWRWALDEGDFGGGPVSSWCCPADSITGAAETVARVTAALLEWRGWLEDLATRFDRYPLAGLSDPDRFQAWERGTVQLVHHVVDRTGAGDAWYRHCAQVLTWFSARWGVAGDSAQRLVDEAIGGRFGSWVGPAETVVDDIAERIARAATAYPVDQARDRPLA
ncbi:hypothetical protein [Nocardia sp. NBC_00416]|uniref:hypothetical protein n=1 Tax=Nocardia sp. NBC_00416 TaxID=2975991 RepID=UPI002E1E7002